MDYTLNNNLRGYVKVHDYTVSSATTSYDITGLNITKEDDYILVSNIVNAGSGGLSFYLYANGNYTTSNYYAQYLYASGSSVGAGRANYPYFADTDGSGKNEMFTSIKLTNNGYFVAQSNNTKTYGGSSILLTNFYETSTFTSTSITSLRIQANVSNAIGVGSRFQLYKRVAPVVADIIVSSATTSIDITGLDIGKDSEYMLVSDITGAGSNTNVNLTINGNNTTTNYYSQELGASLSSIGANRTNSAGYLLSVAGYKVFGHTNLKLTNNGYFIGQTNEIAFYGFSSQIENYFITSTFTSTSITSIKITSVANGIGIGSRFQLIKLK